MGTAPRPGRGRLPCARARARGRSSWRRAPASLRTQARVMSTLQYKVIDPERLDAMRSQGADEFGNPWKQRTAEGWEPLRCCLRTAREGEDIALISYSPWPQPWD